MTYEMVVALTVHDDDLYRRYRDAMTPLLEAKGGGFRYDFTIAEVLKSASEHPINRVFAIHFADRAQRDALFADPDYLAARQRFFEPAVSGITVIGEYER